MRTSVLDHGYVEKIETWGSDERIVEAARMSTGKGFLGWGPKHDELCARRESHDGTCICTPKEGDEKLLAFLWNNRHATPFEMAGATFEIQAPIFVFREWHRHRTQSYNELSARYTQLPDLQYVPSHERVRLGGQSVTNRQGSQAMPIPPMGIEEFHDDLREVYEHSRRVYTKWIERGMAKELARLPAPVAQYSRMRASANLRNWLAFLSLRSTAKGPSAQWEIRQFADAVHAELREAFPRTLALFDGGAP